MAKSKSDLSDELGGLIAETINKQFKAQMRQDIGDKLADIGDEF